MTYTFQVEICVHEENADDAREKLEEEMTRLYCTTHGIGDIYVHPKPTEEK